MILITFAHYNRTAPLRMSKARTKRCDDDDIARTFTNIFL